MNVYFDNSATTPVDPSVVQSMTEVLSTYYGNPSSLHQLGTQAEQLMSRAKAVIAKQLNVNSKEIIFTSGGTESNNLAIQGVAFEHIGRGRHIITSQIEHSSVYEVCRILEERHGYKVTYLPVNEDGFVTAEDVNNALTEETILVTLMHVNNEIGSVQPIHRMGSLLKQHPKVLFHIDAVQSIGKVPFDPQRDGIDLLSVSGHKIHAPKGTGFLYVREGIKLTSIFHGGGQEKGIRPGTENVAGAVALAKAVRLVKENETEHIEHMQRLRQRLVESLQSMEGVYINSPLHNQYAAPHIVNISVPGIKPEVLVHALEEKGIYVSTRSACSSKVHKPSRVLKAIGLEDERALCALRVSFSKNNTMDEVDFFVQTFQQLVPHYRAIVNQK